MKLRIKTPKEVFSHQVEGPEIMIGRSSENDFVIPLEDFSRKHCKITFKGTYVYIMDLGSKNGVMIDGKRIKPHEQYPIYLNSRVILANLFEFILPEGTSIKNLKDTNDGVLELDLAEIPKRR